MINHASIIDQQLLASRTGLREHRESTLSLLVRSCLCLLMSFNKYVDIQSMKEKEKEEITNLTIPELKEIQKELDKQLNDIVTEHGTTRTEFLAIVSERKKIDTEIKVIQTLDTDIRNRFSQIRKNN